MSPEAVICPACGAAIPDGAAWESLGMHAIERIIVTCCPLVQMVLRRQVDGEWRSVWGPAPMQGGTRRVFACTRQDMQRGGWE